MTIVTKTGDKGETGLFGGKRVSKTDPRIEAIGTVDELNALLGCVVAETSIPAEIRDGIERIQHQLFIIGSDLATPLESTSKTKRIEESHVQSLEEWINSLEASLPALTAFILPSGSMAGSLIHHARAVCRRSERAVVATSRDESLNTQVQIYLNRLSDLLFLLARAINKELGAEETKVIYD